MSFAGVINQVNQHTCRYKYYILYYYYIIYYLKLQQIRAHNCTGGKFYIPKHTNLAYTDLQSLQEYYRYFSTMTDAAAICGKYTELVEPEAVSH